MSVKTGGNKVIRIRYENAYPGGEVIRLDEHHADAIDYAHTHDFYEIFVVTAGRVLHEIRGQADALPAGSAMFIRPRDAHRFGAVDREPYEFVNIPFTPAAFRAAIAYLDAAEPAEALCARAEPPAAALDAEALGAFLRDARGSAQSPDRERALRALLARLMVDFFLRRELAPSPARPDWMRALLAELERPANLRRGVAGLRDKSGLSPSYLCRAFKKYLGVTPTDHVNRMRLDYAKYLLKYTNRSVLDIAMECGYDNLSHFYHLFTRAESAAPAAFRRAFRMQSETGK
jgi:AraC family cel operon transcriptional repressor